MLYAGLPPVPIRNQCVFIIKKIIGHKTGKQYYTDHDKDGERHKALFVIKNRLSDNDCDLFEDWLKLNHTTKMHHWLSHKKIVKLRA